MAVRRPSVAMLVAATLVTVTTLLLVVFGTLNYRRRHREEWSRLTRVTNAQTTELAVALAVPVWNIDRAQIEKILDSQAEVQPIEGIVVQAAGKTHARVRDAQRRFVPSNGTFPTAGLLHADSPIVFEREQIGTVRVFTTPAFVQQMLRDELIRTVQTILTVDLLLIFVVSLVLWRIVLRPLKEIERYAGGVSAGGHESAAAVVAGPTAELENLRVSIETMVRLLDDRYVELRESENRFRTIFESVNDAIFIADADGTVLDVNARMCEMFGYTREEALTANIGVPGIGEALAGNEQIFEWQARRRDGRLFWTEISTRVATIDGKACVIFVVRDIDQRKEMERELRRRERMSAMGTLVAGVAHEVRNPLFGMTALLDAFANALATPALARFSDNLREQVRRITDLTRDLLQYGTPVTITLVPGSLRELLDEVVKFHADAASGSKVTLSNTIGTSLPPTPMDRVRMRQVFDNLIDNALQHSPPNGTITIAAREVVHGGRSWLDCTVEDEGKGFREGDLDRVFEPFFTRRERGTGLGMSIVQRIVEEHAGRVTAANRSEGGAVITVRLPVAQ